MADSMSRLHNPRRAGAEEKMASRHKPETKEAKGEAGNPVQGDSMHAAAESMHKADPHSKHMIMSHDGFGMKTHSIDEQGQHDGTHEDDTEHMHRFMGEDGQDEGQSEGGAQIEPEEHQSIY